MKSIEEINLAMHDGRTPPIMVIDYVLEIVTRANFEAIFAQLDPDLQQYLTEYAERCVHSFDEILEGVRERPALYEAWLAYREWAQRHPWFEEALDRPRPRRWNEEERWLFSKMDYATELLKRASESRERARVTGGDIAEWDTIVADLTGDVARITAAYEEKRDGLDAAHAAREEERLRQRKQQKS